VDVQAVGGLAVVVRPVASLGVVANVHKELEVRHVRVLVPLHAVEGEGAARAVELHHLGALLIRSSVVDVEEAHGRLHERDVLVIVVDEARPQVEEALVAQVDLEQVFRHDRARLAAVVQVARRLQDSPGRMVALEVTAFGARARARAQDRPRRDVLRGVLDDQVDWRRERVGLDPRQLEVRSAALVRYDGTLQLCVRAAVAHAVHHVVHVQDLPGILHGVRDFDDVEAVIGRVDGRAKKGSRRLAAAFPVAAHRVTAEVGHSDVRVLEVDVRARGIDAGIGEDIRIWCRSRVRIRGWVGALC